jgi:uncharacterized protein YxeA
VKKMSRRRRKNKLYSKVILIFVLVVILILILKGTFARYSSSGKSEANVDVAFYLLKEEQLSQTVALEEMQPSDDVYTYTFSVANNDGTNRTETALKYTISIKMTTNLPLTYSLYMNEGTENLFENYTTEQDEDNTWFKQITSSECEFGFETDQQNTYKLEVKFPKEYNSVEYQGIIEALEIKVDSEQIV